MWNQRYRLPWWLWDRVTLWASAVSGRENSFGRVRQWAVNKHWDRDWAASVHMAFGKGKSGKLFFLKITVLEPNYEREMTCQWQRAAVMELMTPSEEVRVIFRRED